MANRAGEELLRVRAHAAGRGYVRARGLQRHCGLRGLQQVRLLHSPLGELVIGWVREWMSFCLLVSGWVGKCVSAWLSEWVSQLLAGVDVYSCNMLFIFSL